MGQKPQKGRQTANGARERIVAAALEVFAERGFDGAHTREIAERAGANLGLIKYYFNDKERLWKASVARSFAELQADLAGEPGNGCRHARPAGSGRPAVCSFPRAPP